MSHPSSRPSSESHGLAAAAFAFLLWGFLPLYWKQLTWLKPDEVIACRAIGCAPVLLLLLLWRTHDRLMFLRALRDAQTMHRIFWSALLLAANWLLYVWATVNDLIVEASLGYFLTPLANVALGAIFLKEKIRPAQRVAFGFAAVGVLVQLVGLGHVPWIALVLSGTFSVYGLLRKMARVDALPGLALETFLFLPLAVVWLGAFGPLPPATTQGQWGWLVLLGVVTVLPLWSFAYGARNLSMATLGLVQFLTPTLQFLIGWQVYGEPLELARIVSFVIIWIGLAIFLRDLVRRGR